jgi:uncharacterized protein YciI
MSTLFLVFRDPGPSWVPGVPARQQPLWDDHAAFMDGLFEEGRVVLGGPYADCRHALVILEARDTEEALALFRGDPWEKAGISFHPRLSNGQSFVTLAGIGVQNSTVSGKGGGCSRSPPLKPTAEKRDGSAAYRSAQMQRR